MHPRSSDTSNVALPATAFVASSARMTSKEIADLCGKRHDNARRTIETLADQGVIVRPQIEDEPETDAMGRTRVTKVYVFTGERGKRDSIVVMAQLSPEFTAALVDRWQEIEKLLAEPSFVIDMRDANQLRIAAVQLIEMNQEKDERIAVLEPKAEALDRIAHSDGSLCVTDTAKTIGVRPKDLFQFMHSHGWIYTRAGSNERIAYQSKLQTGLLEHKTTVVTRSDGSEKTTTQVRVTPKGLTRLAKEFPPVAQAA